jgi:hypothetical protein
MIKCEFCGHELFIDPVYMNNLSFNDMMKGWWVCQKCKPKLFGSMK